MKAKAWTILVIIIFILIFLVQNTGATILKLLLWVIAIP